jgi:hypothetical protein
VTILALLVSLLMGIGSLAWGFYTSGYTQPAIWLMGLGLVWALCLWRRWWWFASLGLIASVSAAAAGLWLGLGPGWMITGCLGALMTWDLSDFARRLRSRAGEDDLHALERAHIARLTILAVLGLLLATAAMLVRLRFSFEWAALLVLVAALGLTQLISWLRRGGS